MRGQRKEIPLQGPGPLLKREHQAGCGLLRRRGTRLLPEVLPKWKCSPRSVFLARGYGAPDDHFRTSARVHAFEVRHGRPLRPSQNRSYRQKRKQRKKRQEHKRGPKHISEKVGHLHSALLGNGVDHKVWRIADIG